MSWLFAFSNMFLGGVEGHHGWGKDAVNWYVEAHDTREYEPNQLQLYPPYL
jgi:hypothetical protein